MTPRERDVLNFIKMYAKKHNILPTVRDICDGVGLASTASVHKHMDNLTAKGYITREWGSARYAVKGLKYVEV